jgi:serine/threonine protein kinase
VLPAYTVCAACLQRVLPALCPPCRYELLLPKHTSLRYRVPAADEGFLDFLSYLLTPDPSARPSASEALQHPWLAHPYPPVEQIPD